METERSGITMSTLLHTFLAVLVLGCQPPSSAAGQLSAEPATPAQPTSTSSPGTDTDEPGPVRDADGRMSSKPGEALVLSGEQLRPGCVRELATDLNGDRVAQSIDWAGCNKSNRQYDNPGYWQGGTLWFDETPQGDRFGYSVYRRVDERTYILSTKLETSGSFAGTEYVAVRRGEMMDHNPIFTPPLRSITTLTRLGSVHSAKEVDGLIKAVVAK